MFPFGQSADPGLRTSGWWPAARRMAVPLAVLAACVDGPTGPGSQTPARLRVTVVLPPATPSVWWPAGDTLRVVVRRAGRVEPIVDSAAATDSLSATVVVPLAQAVERFVATAEVKYDEQVLFLAFESIQLRAGLDTTLALVATYVGPGTSAVAFALEARDSTLALGDTTSLVPVAWDSLGQVIANVPTRYTSRRPDLFAVDVRGVVTALGGLPDTARVEGVLPIGLSGSVLLAITATVTGGRRTWAGGDVTGPTDWFVAANWTPVGVPGALDTVVIPTAPAQPVLTANVAVGQLTIIGSGNLTLNGRTVTVAGDFTTGPNGGMVTMTAPADVLVVSGDVVFAGDVTTGRLTAGVLRVGGDFRQQYIGSNWAAFAPSGTHRVVLDGGGTQTVAFDSPTGAPGQASFFHHLDIATTGGGVTVGTGAVANGSVRIVTPTSVTGPGTLTVGDSLVTVAGSNVTLNGVRLGGGMAVAGTFSPALSEFFGAGQTMQAQLGYQDVLVTGQTTFGLGGAGSVDFGVIGGDLTIRGTGAEAAFPATQLQVRIDGTLTTGPNGGRLAMTDGNNLLTVAGNALFAGDVTTGRLTAGVLRVGGDFRQQYIGSNWAAFAPNGAHRVMLDGTGDQLVQFDSPTGAPGQASFFQALTLSKPSGAVRLLSTVVVNGALEADGQTVLGGGNALDAAGAVGVTNLVLDDVPLTLRGGPILQVDSVTFQNVAPTATQLTLIHPGSATAFTFTGLRFLTTPTTGYYVSATDVAPADGNTFTVNLIGAEPTDGSARTATVGGAVVNWGAGSPTFAAVDAGQSFTCGLVTGGAAYCWGANTAGQLGDGTTAAHSVPMPVLGGLAFGRITAGGEHACALTSAGAAYCWGSNAYGQLGDGTSTDRLTPSAVAGGLSFTAIAAGEQHTCAIAAGGSAYCWGRNTNGQLGDGTTTDRAVPAVVSGALPFESVSAAIGQHTCAVTPGGAAYCWGRNTNGQLGDGSTTDRLTPVAVSGGLTFALVSASANEHSCGVTTGGAAYCWGWNPFGALGDGTTTTRTTPVAVSGGLTFASVTGGANGFSCGLTTGGAGYCWGLNNVGQLGDGTTTSRLTPVPVAGGLAFVQLDAGFAHVAAVATGGAGYGWGGNTQGQVGDGTTINRNVPTSVVPPTP